MSHPLPTPMDSEESARLLHRARTGDDSALWQLTEQLRPYLKAVVRQGLGHDFLAKLDDSDIVQQSMVRAVEKFEGFEGRTLEQWQAWLVAIAQNEAKNAVRFWRQQRRDAHRERPNPAGNGEVNAASDQSTPSQIVSRRERAARLMATIGRLPQDQQQLILWRHVDNLPHADIARRLGISVDACRQRWKTVLDKLGQMWREAE